MENSRARAKTWTYPRHLAFEKALRLMAANWFRAKGFATHQRYPYILADYADWAKNIILPEVAAYIRSQRKGFPLHKYIHHGLSSQAMLFNLVGPLIVRQDLEPLQNTLRKNGVVIPDSTISASLEYEDRRVFNEDAGQPTSIDLVLHDSGGSAFLFIESKLVETGFGGCSVFSQGDCDGRNPAEDFSLCYLHHIGRRYWELLDKYGFLEGALRHNLTCMLAAYYQFFREVILALELGGSFVLLYDQRNPSFECSGSKGKRGVMPFLLSLVPAALQSKIHTITMQQLAADIRATGRHDWMAEFDQKYGLAEPGTAPQA